MEQYIGDALKIAIYESIFTDCIIRFVGAALLLNDETGSKSIIYQGHNGNEEDSCIAKDYCRREARQERISSVLSQYKDLELGKDELRAHVAFELFKKAQTSSFDNSLIEAVNLLATGDDIDCPSHCAEEYCITQALKKGENLKGGVLVCTDLPCENCIDLIEEYGISTVYFWRYKCGEQRPEDWIRYKRLKEKGISITKIDDAVGKALEDEVYHDLEKDGILCRFPRK